MSKDGDRQSVFRTTKVRTSLKGDSSWIHRCSEEEEKPWVRPKRLSTSSADLSPISSPTTIERVPQSVLPSSGSPIQVEPPLSPDEPVKQTKEANGVLKTSPVQGSSYVLSIARRFESIDPPQTSPTKTSWSFVAKRVVIKDEEEEDVCTETTKDITPTASLPQEAVHEATPLQSSTDAESGQKGQVGQTPAEASAKETAVDGTQGSVVESAAQPTQELAEEPTQGHTEKIAVETTQGSAEEAAEELAVEPTQAPAEESVQVPAEEPANEPAQIPVAEPAEEPAQTPAAEPAEEPAQIPAAEHAEEPAQAAVEEPAQAPAEEPAQTPAAEPAEEPAQVPAAEHAEEPAQAAVEEPAQAPAEEPAQTPAAEPAEEPAQAAVEEPAQAPAKEPAQAAVEEPTQAAVEESAQAIAVQPAQAPAAEPPQAVAEEPAQAPAKEPAEEPVQEPTQAAVEESAQAVAEEPAQALAAEPAQAVAEEPAQAATEEPAKEPAEEPANDEEIVNVTHQTNKLETCSDLPSSLESASQNAEAPDSETKKGFVFVKEYVNTTELSKHNTAGAENDKGCVGTSACKCCGEPVGSDGRIIIEHLNVSYHPNCFKCGVCAKPMGDLLYSMFLRGAVVYCDTCYPSLS